MLGGHIIYFFALCVLGIGLFIMITSTHYLKKLFGLIMFQNSVLIFYISLGKVHNAVAPIYDKSDLFLENKLPFSSPLPHVLMLTAIVVGFATLAVGLTIIYRIHSLYGTVDESELNQKLTDDNN